MSCGYLLRQVKIPTPTKFVTYDNDVVIVQSLLIGTATPNLVILRNSPAETHCARAVPTKTAILIFNLMVTVPFQLLLRSFGTPFL